MPARKLTSREVRGQMNPEKRDTMNPQANGLRRIGKRLRFPSLMKVQAGVIWLYDLIDQLDQPDEGAHHRDQARYHLTRLWELGQISQRDYVTGVGILRQPDTLEDEPHPQEAMKLIGLRERRRLNKDGVEDLKA